MVVVESCLHSDYRGKKLYSTFHFKVVEMILQEYPDLHSWLATSSDWSNYKGRFGPNSVFRLWSKWVDTYFPSLKRKIMFLLVTIK